ncbi:MAG: histidine kinase [Dysosmobacter sp.]
MCSSPRSALILLHNTLDSVVWMTENGCTQDAVVTLHLPVPGLLHLPEPRQQNVIPIADELEHARHYLTIQKMRYKNKFSTDIIAEDGVESLYTI